MGLRSRFVSWRDKQDAIGAVEGMRRQVADLRDQTMTPPFDYFVEFEQDDLTELLNRMCKSMDDFIDASDKRLAELHDGKR